MKYVVSTRTSLLAWLASLLVVLTHASTNADQTTDQVLAKGAPTNVNDLLAMDGAIKDVVEKVMPATVGVRVGGAEASGVVVTEDGYVLTASHVAMEPGRRVRIVFNSGRIAQGRTLGMNPDVDGAMIKISESGKWPFAPLASEKDQPEAGDWCVAIGHPGGVKPLRTPPVRFGRVISSNNYVVRTDCLISPGDSGGPLFDMRGNVIGIHSRISEDDTDNLHVPAISFSKTWEALKRGTISEVAPNSQFLAEFDANEDGKLELKEMSGMHRRVYERLADAFGFDTSTPQPIDDLREKLGMDIAPRGNRLIRDADTFYTGTISGDDMLLSSRFTRGSTVLRAYREVVAKARQGVVEVILNKRRVALGTTVTDDGWVVTKASELRTKDSAPEISLRFSNGKTVVAEKVRVDDALDLAWLRVKYKIRGVTFANDANIELGQMVVSVGRGSTPASTGVVSVQPRRIPRTQGFMGVSGDGFFGGAVVRSIIEGGGASRSDLKVDDIILSVTGRSVRTFRDLSSAVQSYRPGDLITLRVKRDEQELDIEVKLGVHPQVSGTMETNLTGPTSDRLDDFAVALQHDSVLKPNDCGGPLLNLSGECIGVNIARSERTASYAVPASEIQRILKELRATETNP